MLPAGAGLGDPGLLVRDELLTKIVDSHCLWLACRLAATITLYLPTETAPGHTRYSILSDLIITKPRTSEKRLRDGINETKLCLMFPIWFL